MSVSSFHCICFNIIPASSANRAGVSLSRRNAPPVSFPSHAKPAPVSVLSCARRDWYLSASCGCLRKSASASFQLRADCRRIYCAALSNINTGGVSAVCLSILKMFKILCGNVRQLAQFHTPLNQYVVSAPAACASSARWLSSIFHRWRRVVVVAFHIFAVLLFRAGTRAGDFGTGRAPCPRRVRCRLLSLAAAVQTSPSFNRLRHPCFPPVSSSCFAFNRHSDGGN